MIHIINDALSPEEYKKCLEITEFHNGVVETADEIPFKYLNTLISKTSKIYPKVANAKSYEYWFRDYLEGISQGLDWHYNHCEYKSDKSLAVPICSLIYCIRAEKVSSVIQMRKYHGSNKIYNHSLKANQLVIMGPAIWHRVTAGKCVRRQTSLLDIYSEPTFGTYIVPFVVGNTETWPVIKKMLPNSGLEEQLERLHKEYYMKGGDVGR